MTYSRLSKMHKFAANDNFDVAERVTWNQQQRLKFFVPDLAQANKSLQMTLFLLVLIATASTSFFAYASYLKSCELPETRIDIPHELLPPDYRCR